MSSAGLSEWKFLADLHVQGNYNLDIGIVCVNHVNLERIFAFLHSNLLKASSVSSLKCQHRGGVRACKHGREKPDFFSNGK